MKPDIQIIVNVKLPSQPGREPLVEMQVGGTEDPFLIHSVLQTAENMTLNKLREEMAAAEGKKPSPMSRVIRVA